MKRKYTYAAGKKTMEREYSYIPFRYILAVLISCLEILAVIGTVIACCYYIPYFYIAAWATQIFCVVRVIASDDNPDYKAPWLLVLMLIPIVGFMLYFLFYSRKLKPRYVKRMRELQKFSYQKDDTQELAELERENPLAASQARMLTNIAGTHLFSNTRQTYFSLGEELHAALLADLQSAKSFIYMEYFIIEEGRFWNSILEILQQKAAAGLDVRVVYDDIGCMNTLPGNYKKELASHGIVATPFSRLRGNADSEFNNRSHRKITVIDGTIGYTGGVNLADEYINETVKFGHWKDTGVRLEGEAVHELTRLFLIDFGINVKKLPEIDHELFPTQPKKSSEGFVIPFGDGPNPTYTRRVGKSVIQNLLNHATHYVYMTTPYLIIDNDLCVSIENAALRGVKVKIIVPHIPDKKLVFAMTRSFYHRLMQAGVEIYEYKPGFIHAKSYLADDRYAMIGTINLDYRSLVHHFENGVWMYGTDTIQAMKRDIEDTLEKSLLITPDTLKTSLLQRALRSLIRIFSPLL